MFKNYIVTALRNLFKQKIYSLINISGLAVGMALCILVMVYVMDELSFDRFHEKGDRIYRVAQVEDHNGVRSIYTGIGGGITTKMETDFPEAVEKRVRLLGLREVWTKIDDRLFHEKRTFVVDETFFDIFSFDFLAGNPDTALKEPNSAVLAAATAVKYFGGTDVLGKTIKVDVPGAPLLKITGVIKDAPRNSHFHPDMLVPLSTIRNEKNAPFFEQMTGNNFWSYILVKEGYPVRQLTQQFPAFLKKHLNEKEHRLVVEIYLQPLHDIHLKSTTDPFTEVEPENTGNITYLYIFSVIALLVLVVACINFMNLATARSANRAREVGMRKVNGATRQQLAIQFTGESMFISLLSLPLAVILAFLFLPLFNSVAGKDMSLHLLTDPVLLVGLVAMVLFVGLVSGSYPAFFLSSFQPVAVLKGKKGAEGKSGLLRKILVIGQFAVSIVFFIAALVILRQMFFMTDGDLGYDKKNVAVVPVILPVQPDDFVDTVEYLKNEFAKLPGVESVSAASGFPSDIRNIVNGRMASLPEEQSQLMTLVAVDYDFIGTTGIEIIEGRNFSKEHSTDAQGAVLINEAVFTGPDKESPVGKPFIAGAVKGPVVGVFKSPHWEPKRRQIFPMIFYLNPKHTFKLGARLNPDSIPATLAAMEKIWDKRVTQRPFRYDFLEDTVAALYKSENRFTRLIIYFTILTIFVACLGLLGLASFTAEQRTREIGIRKVLGASVGSVVFLLLRQFGRLVLIANLVAWPVAFYAMHKWLQNFYYRVGIQWDVFVLSALAVMIIASVTISFQSVKAALTNPVNTLRCE
jgi:putative ABC transport system permease protein